MTKLVNPKIKIKITTDEEIVIDDADVEFDISKDRSEEPNEASLRVWNLEQGLRERIKIAGDNDAPIEIFLTAGGRSNEDPVRAFAGEIDFASSNQMSPGVETEIVCMSQKRINKQFFFQKAYSAGTSNSQIINDMVSAIGLPVGNKYDLPDNTILLSQSFQGAAYPLLQRFVFDIGMYCYALDGKLYITSVYEPPTPTVYDLSDALMISTPEISMRKDRTQVEMKMLTETSRRSPFNPKYKQSRRRSKDVLVFGQSDLVEYETIDDNIPGMRFHMFAQPGIDPDLVVRWGGLMYRVDSINHYGNTFGGDWDSNFETDEYKETGGDFLSDVSGDTSGGEFLIL